MGKDRAIPGYEEMSVSVYLAEHATTPLLTAEEEVELAIMIKRGGSAAKQAFEKFVQCNQRLVFKIARRYQGRGVPLMDLLQEGNIGLLRAIAKFDPDRKFRFSTYAIWWIRQSIFRALAEQGRLVRLPVHVAETLRKAYLREKELSEQLRREPTEQEIAASLQKDADELKSLQSIAREPLSLDAPIGENTDLGQYIVSPLNHAAEGRQEQAELRGNLEQALSTLSVREQDVLKLRFGLGEQEPHSLQEIGDRLGISRERVRQIEKKALEKLKNSPMSAGLPTYMH